jgi:hypothetical protein
LSDPSTLVYPFIDKHSDVIDQEGYMIQLLGEAEKSKILADEKPLLDELCAYREILCLSPEKHADHH